MGSDQVAERLSNLTVGDSPGTPGVSTPPVVNRREPVLPEQALRLTRPTEGFLCAMSANKYKIDFREFEIKDYDSGESLFHVKRDPEAALPTVPDDIDPAMEAEAVWCGADIRATRLRACVSTVMHDAALAPGAHAITGGLGGLGLRAAEMLTDVGGEVTLVIFMKTPFLAL